MCQSRIDILGPPRKHVTQSVPIQAQAADFSLMVFPRFDNVPKDIAVKIIKARKSNPGERLLLMSDYSNGFFTTAEISVDETTYKELTEPCDTIPTTE